MQFCLKMKKICFPYLFAAFVVLSVTACAHGQKIKSSEIKWDNWGVPHVFGRSDEEAYYGFGWAQMEAHANLILKLYGKARGRASEYFGGMVNETSDVLLRKLHIPDRAEQWYELQDSETKCIIQAFVKGMNDYCDAHPDSIDNELKGVLPVTKFDPLAKLQMSYHLMVGAFALQPQASEWKTAGSNAWALGSNKTTSGFPILLMQPHPPWFDDYLFFEAHLKSNDLNLYGITLIGSPTIAMGFNQNLGWGMTFNQADAMDLIELETVGNSYRSNGILKPFKISSSTYKVKIENTLIEKEVQIKESEFGSVVEERPGKALVLRLSGLDRPYFTKQFLDMGKAQSFKEFEDALKLLQLPLQNIVYADKSGNIFYLYNGIIPKRPAGDRLNDWSGVIKSTRTGAKVEDYVPYSQLPKILNPESNFVANSNNGPWTSTYPFLKPPANVPSYLADVPYMNFDNRSRSSIKMILSQPKLDFDSVVELSSSTYSELADRSVDELVEFGESSSDTILVHASKVLKDWDRRLDNGSKGAILFLNWFNVTRSMEVFLNHYSVNDPLNTPNTITISAKRALLEASKNTLNKYGSLDVAFQDVYNTNFANKSLVGGLGLSEVGSFNAGFYRPISATKFTLLGGAAFTSVVEFGPKVKAKGLLSYGNASQGNSESKSDQLEMMINRQMRDIFFYDNDISKHTQKKEILSFK